MLSSQLLLGILSRRLAPGEKLPSVRDLARRLAILGTSAARQRCLHSIADIQAAIGHQSQPIQLQRFVVVDPDPELAKVLAAELAEATGHPVSSAACTCIIATQCHATEVAAATGNTPLRIIQLRSMQDVLKGQQRPPFPVLIAIVSRSKSILAWASR